MYSKCVIECIPPYSKPSNSNLKQSTQSPKNFDEPNFNLKTFHFPTVEANKANKAPNFSHKT